MMSYRIIIHSINNCNFSGNPFRKTRINEMVLRITIYSLISIGIPSILLTYLNYFYDDKYSEDIIKYRLYPLESVFDTTEFYMKKFGIFEIIVKLLTLGCSLGICFTMWNSNKKLKVNNVTKTVITARKSIFKRF